MGCCGRKMSGGGTRYRYHTPVTAGHSLLETDVIPANRPKPVIYFQYTGSTRLVAIGAVTRNRYVFSESEDIVGVAREDSYSMLAVPSLQAVKTKPENN